MSLRWKFALAMAMIATITAIVFGTASYRSTRDQLYAEVDRSLIAVGDRRGDIDELPERGPFVGFDAQVIGPDGTVRASTFEPPISPTEADLALVGRRGSRIATVDTEDGSYRVRTVGSPRGAFQVGRSLAETERILASLRVRTLLIAGLVAALAIALGLWISGRVTASLRRLTAAAEHVEETGRLDVEVGEDGADEVGRLGVAFDRMLAALSRSKDQQRRLVEDAGHELRTPLTSLRTNLDALRRYPDMSAEDRDAILVDLHEESLELSSLVDEVVAVASGGANDEQATSFDLAEIAGDVTARFERRSGRDFEVRGESEPVTAQRSAVQRAISCLVENAVKFDTTGGPIVVEISDRSVTVLDRGVGIPEAELSRIFDRFHRADAARTMAGSGLGLSIVREVAVRHGGDAFARNRADGGAAVGFCIGEPPASLVA